MYICVYAGVYTYIMYTIFCIYVCLCAHTYVKILCMCRHCHEGPTKPPHFTSKRGLGNLENRPRVWLNKMIRNEEKLTGRDTANDGAPTPHPGTPQGMEVSTPPPSLPPPLKCHGMPRRCTSCIPWQCSSILTVACSAKPLHHVSALQFLTKEEIYQAFVI